MPLHMLKLCVGVESIDHLAAIRKDRQQYLADGTACHYHITRFRPKRAPEILAGGSIYWIIKGFVQLRQRIIAFDRIETDSGIKCRIVMDTAIIRTESQPRRPHQGWRYLTDIDAPRDIATTARSDSLPPDLSQKLREMGLI
ncbi:MAG: DUF1489 domain-containing protein [Alphaproteobacteria bacterium]|nr:DUF1489 domain-containing protein [Alphaproteobacteria bacterium]